MVNIAEIQKQVDVIDNRIKVSFVNEKVTLTIENSMGGVDSIYIKGDDINPYLIPSVHVMLSALDRE
jgi:hypothetical protein